MSFLQATIRHARSILLTAACVFAAFAIAGHAADDGSGHVRVYPAPAAQDASKDFTVTAGGRAVPVYLAKVALADPVERDKWLANYQTSGGHFDSASVASFDMDGAVTVTVECPAVIQSAKILPTSAGIVPRIDGKKLTFPLSEPRLLTIEINGNWSNSLHLFANPFEVDPPRQGDPNVLYLGPGIYDLPDGLKIGDNKTLYLAGGALLRGTGAKGVPVVSLQGKHIRLRGRGAIDGCLCPPHSRDLLGVSGSDISVEGVTLLDSSSWTMPIRKADRVTVTNVKVFGYRSNSDGIDICNSRDVTVDGCFLRTSDDLIVVKSDKGQGPVQRVTAKNCVLWNELAHALSIGAELRENVDDVLFTNCDVIHDKGREWTLRIYHCDYALVSNVRFENIRIEESARPISLWIGKTIWSLGPERGNIRDVTFKDVRGVAAAPLKIELQGFDLAHTIDNVRFEDVRFNDKPLTREDVKANEFVHGVTVQPASGIPPIAAADDRRRTHTATPR